MARELRKRKPAVYNVDALELLQGRDVNSDIEQGPTRNSSQARKRSLSKSESAEVASSVEDASESEDDFMEAPKRQKPASRPTRMQPRRAATHVGIVDDSDNDEDEHQLSSDQEDELPINKLPRSSVGNANGVRRGLRPRTQHELSDKENAGDGKKAVKQSKKKPLKRASRVKKTQTTKQKEILPKAAKRKALEIEKVLDVQMMDGVECAHVKFKGKSYRDCEWLPTEALMSSDKAQLLRNFHRKALVDEYGELQNGVHPDWLQVERVIAARGSTNCREYLVKWQGLGYSESTYELEDKLQEDKEHVDAFLRRQTVRPAPRNIKPPKKWALPIFQNGRKLRDYQVESLTWMMENMRAGKNCILGDEMGLGKTAQSIAVLQFQHQLLQRKGPFLVVAPLTTLGHWQREIQTWTDMYCVQYAGTAADREVIQKHELYGMTGKERTGIKFNVLLTSYEMLLRDEKILGRISYDTVIIDEAHRLKSTASQQRGVVDRMMSAGNIKFLLLLTGTPIQNNLRELYGLLSLLDASTYRSEEEFSEKFGGKNAPPTIAQVKALQEALRPVLLRRMKEDVETLPEKEEVIVEVELTQEQRCYYKAIYSQQIGTLMAGASAKNLPNLRNLGMELRKCCNHPYLCNGLEEDILARQASMGESMGELDRLINSSGKMVLLKKLLPKLRKEGHKVLIFSQFKIMLDVLEDAFHMMSYPTERIDGGVAQKDRQAAIDRFSKGDGNTFIFLLSTRAGGQGITLTAADTVIIYDSDWNPQNDLQAMARCHRIGQNKEVTIYRLISRDTYEASIFEASTRKYGLDEAILGNINQTDDPEADDKRIAQLLRHGAHGVFGKEEEKFEAGSAFQAEGIDSILANRTTKRSIGSRKGNTFSRAEFRAEAETEHAPTDDRAYWAALMPEAVATYDDQVAAACRPVELGKRERKVVNYNERMRIAEDSDDDYDVNKELVDKQHVAKDRSKEGLKKAVQEKGPKRWRKHEIRIIENSLLTFGRLTKPEAQMAAWSKAGLEDRCYEEALEVRTVLVRMIKKAAAIHAGKKSEKEALSTWKLQLLQHEAAGLKFEKDPPETTNWDAKSLIPADMGIPAFASEALTAPDLLKRIRKHGTRDLDCMHERESFVRAWKENLTNCLEMDISPLEQLHWVVMPARDLPEFWDISYDEELTQFLYTEGFDRNRPREAAAAFLAAWQGDEFKTLLQQKDPSGDASEEEEDAPDAVPHSKESNGIIEAVAKRARQLVLAVVDPAKSAKASMKAKRLEERNKEKARREQEEEAARRRAQKAEETARRVAQHMAEEAARQVAQQRAEEAEARKDSEREESDMVSEDEDESDSPAVVQAARPISKPVPGPKSKLVAKLRSAPNDQRSFPTKSSMKPSKAAKHSAGANDDEVREVPSKCGQPRPPLNKREEPKACQVIVLEPGSSPSSASNESNYCTTAYRSTAQTKSLQKKRRAAEQLLSENSPPSNCSPGKEVLRVIDMNRELKKGNGQSRLVQSRLNFSKRPRL